MTEKPSPKISALKTGCTVFVTGGSGVVGFATIRKFVSAGHRVRALARTDDAAQIVKAAGGIPVLGDLDNETALKAGMSGALAVVHAASQTAMYGAWEDYLRDTVEGTRKVLEAAKAAGVKRFVLVSSEAVLADGEPIEGADETTPLPKKPIGFFSKSKAMAEEIVKTATNGMETSIIRPALVWGIGDRRLLPGIVETMKSGQWAWFKGGHHKTSTCNAANAAHGIYLASGFAKGGEIYFVTDGPPVEFRDFLTKLVATQGLTAPNKEAPGFLGDALSLAFERAWKITGRTVQPPLTRTEVKLLFKEATVSDNKARQELGYEPVVSIDGGLEELQRLATLPNAGT
jgi:nucleoside-diphosphate-sugar epimerase